MFTDSRNIDRFGRILASAEALQYLEETELPNFEIAYGVTEDSSKDLTIALRRARAHIQDVIGQLYLHRDDRALRGEIRLLLAATREIANSAGGGIAKEFGQRADA